MKRSVFVITCTNVDCDDSYVSVVGAYSSRETAIEKMRESISQEFEHIKEWWEDEDEESVEQEYEEWIEEQYTDEEHTIWSYTSDDPEEYTYRIHAAQAGASEEVYVLLRSIVDGVSNPTEIVAQYESESEARGAEQEFADSVENQSECQYSVHRVEIDA